jgi:hypothetical protein
MVYAPLPLTSSLTELLRGVRDRLHDQSCSSATSIAIAGLAVRLEFGSEALRRKIAPAFGHLETADIAEPQLTIFVREEASLFERVFLLTEFRTITDENEIWLEEGQEYSVILQRQGQFVAVVEWTNETAYWLVPDAASIPYILRAHSLQPLLTYWLGKQKRYLVHGAAVGTGRDGVLILGHNNAGKSTTALTCLLDGMLYISDDHCLVSLDGEALVHSLYGTGKVFFEEMDRFPLLAPAADTRDRPDGEKALYFLASLPAAHLVRCLRLRAILLTRIMDAPRTKLRATDQAEAFRALVESCALHASAARAQALRCFNGIVRQLPAYFLELGADVRSTPPVIRELLARLSD